MLGILGIVSSEKIFFFLTESLWGGAVVALYLGASLVVKLIGK